MSPPKRFDFAPPAIKALPLDHRGYPVPWFASWRDGEPDFALADHAKLFRAVKEGLCWVCGGALGPMKVFLVGPMCVVNRVSAEPPLHPRCANFTVRVCPFLTRPLAKRDERAREEGVDPAGVMIDRNPGVTAAWSTRDFAVERPVDQAGLLFRLGDPVRVTWWREGRAATFEECFESMTSGLPILRELAAVDSAEDQAELEGQLLQAMALLPERDP